MEAGFTRKGTKLNQELAFLPLNSLNSKKLYLPLEILPGTRTVYRRQDSTEISSIVAVD